MLQFRFNLILTIYRPSFIFLHASLYQLVTNYKITNINNWKSKEYDRKQAININISKIYGS